MVDGEPYDEVGGVNTGVALDVSPDRVEINFATSGLIVIASIRSSYLDLSVFAPVSLVTTGLLGNNNGIVSDDWKVRWKARALCYSFLHSKSLLLFFKLPLYKNMTIMSRHSLPLVLVLNALFTVPYLNVSVTADPGGRYLSPLCQTPAGDNITFASPSGPSVSEGTNFCTTYWCTTESISIFTYTPGVDEHDTYNLCDEVYSAPTLDDTVPTDVVEVMWFVNGNA